MQRLPHEFFLISKALVQLKVSSVAVSAVFNHFPSPGVFDKLNQSENPRQQVGKMLENAPISLLYLHEFKSGGIKLITSRTRHQISGTRIMLLKTSG